jgi:hypothetical protein
MDIEFEGDDSGDNIHDGDAEYSFCTGVFSHDKNGEKWVQYVGLRKTTLCTLCAEKV